MRRSALIALLSSVVACSGPQGLFGLEWGMPAEAAAERLGLRCAWRRMPTMPGYENCFGAPTDVWRQSVSSLELTRHDGRLAGIAVWFDDCDIGAVRERLVRELELDATVGEYWSWPNGQIVRLRTRRAGVCHLVVTDAAFGKIYSRWAATSPIPYPWH